MISVALRDAVSSFRDVRLYLEHAEKKSKAIQFILETECIPEVLTQWAKDVIDFGESRKFDYVCAVVGLYGALERYVEEVAMAYCGHLVSITPNYSDLPDKLRTNHFEDTISHLKKTRDSRYEGRLDSLQITRALESCLAGAVPYSFTVESMIYHSANFRPSVIDDYFNKFGVESISKRAVRTAAFVGSIEETGDDIYPQRPEAALDLVNELVVRRNQVAHGDLSDIIAPSGLVPFCDRLEAYVRGLHDVIDDSVVESLAAISGWDHGSPVAVFNHNIVCINSHGQLIRVGDILAIENVEKNWYRATVESIEINGQPVQATPSGQGVKVGLKIDRRCKVSYRIKSSVFSSLE